MFYIGYKFRALCLMLALLPLSAQAQSIQPIDIPPGAIESLDPVLSADGSTIVGTSRYFTNGTYHYETFRWTAQTGAISLGRLSPNDYNSGATGVSAAGNVVVGRSGIDGSRLRAYRWIQATGMVDIGDLGASINGAYGTQAKGVSADGTVIAGLSPMPSGYQAFRWTEQTGMVGLGKLPGAPATGFTFGINISSDGSTIVGDAYDRPFGSPQAFRWTQQTGMVGLGGLPGLPQSNASAVSANGSVVIGGASGPGGVEAFRWTQAEGMVGLGSLGTIFDGTVYTDALACSADASTIVGISVIHQQQAFLWDSIHGIRDLADALETDYHLDLTGWNLLSATGISADGRTLVGEGTLRGDPTYRIWMVHLDVQAVPEPGLLTVMSSLFLAGIFYQRRQR